MIQIKKNPDKESDVKKILNPLVKKWFFNRFKSFSLPQLFGVSEIHSRKNVLVSAPTGATKTLTAFLSILNELVDSSQKGILEDKVYAIYVSPLKALNYDIQHNLKNPLKEMEELGGELGIRVAVRTGDTTQSERSKMLKNPPHILITTPESLAILLTSIKFSEHLKDVQWLIVDEIHALAEGKRGVHLSLLMEHLNFLSPALCRVGLSATVAPIEEVANFLVGNRDCNIIDVKFIKELDLQVMSPVPDLIDTSHGVMHYKMYELIDKLIQKHKTTLVFTNTRAATERVVDHLKTKFPKNYTENIGAHHGSLSKESRHSLETRLREGKIKTVVCSTSLELGIDIGFIDLVICLGSPKSVARFLQRAGRAGHKLHEKIKARIIVLDRDDLVECSVLMKAAKEKKIDRLHIPKNSLDILSQMIFGFALERTWEEEELYEVLKQSYCYSDLKKEDYNQILDYLAGTYVDLEDRNIYAKIWRKEGKIGKRGKMSRVIYMTNLGTIPDESFVTVKVGTQIIGKLDEGFVERLKPGDVFVLGGETYRYKFSRGMVIQVDTSVNRPPTVPRWVSESLPLSFDLAMEIGKFRRLMLEKFNAKIMKKEIIDFIHDYLYVDKNAAESIYKYFKEQYNYVKIFPTDKTILIEKYYDPDRAEHKIMFHTLYGRRVNDCLSRAIGYIVSKVEKKNIEIGINDNGFYLVGRINVKKIMALLKSDKLELLLNVAIDNNEVFKRRFRQCAGRSLMILRNYKGRQKRVGRQQVSSMILMKALKRISNEFFILKEARREVLEDLMDLKHAKEIIKKIENKNIQIKEIETNIPTPFGFNLALMGVMDILKIEDRMEFLRRMHKNVLVKSSLRKDFDYHDMWEAEEQEEFDEEEAELYRLKLEIGNLDLPLYVQDELMKLLENQKARMDILKEEKVIEVLKENKKLKFLLDKYD